MAGKKPNIFEQRRRMIDQASGWEDPPSAPAPSDPDGDSDSEPDSDPAKPKKGKPKGLRRLF